MYTRALNLCYVTGWQRVSPGCCRCSGGVGEKGCSEEFCRVGGCAPGKVQEKRCLFWSQPPLIGLLT